MDTTHALLRRLDRLERRVRRMRLILIAMLLLLGVGGLTAWSRPEPEVLRAQRFVAVDDRGKEVGEFGFKRNRERASVGWNLQHPSSDAHISCAVFPDPEEGVDAQRGAALLQLEAGHAISQHVVRSLDESCSVAFITGKGEKTAARLTARPEASELVLALGPYRSNEDGEEDESRALRLAYEADGPGVTGVDLDGATTISLP